MIETTFSSPSGKALLKVMVVLVRAKKGFYFSPRNHEVRMQIRNRDRLRKIEEEVKEKGLPVKITHTYWDNY